MCENFRVNELFVDLTFFPKTCPREKMLDEIDVWLKREKLGNIVAFVTSE